MEYTVCGLYLGSLHDFGELWACILLLGSSPSRTGSFERLGFQNIQISSSGLDSLEKTAGFLRALDEWKEDVVTIV
jgi:hypothetical protein